MGGGVSGVPKPGQDNPVPEGGSLWQMAFDAMVGNNTPLSDWNKLSTQVQGKINKEWLAIMADNTFPSGDPNVVYPNEEIKVPALNGVTYAANNGGPANAWTTGMTLGAGPKESGQSSSVMSLNGDNSFILYSDGTVELVSSASGKQTVIWSNAGPGSSSNDSAVASITDGKVQIKTYNTSGTLLNTRTIALKSIIGGSEGLIAPDGNNGLLIDNNKPNGK